MNATPAITHAELATALDDLRFGVGPSDLHGSLTGFLCGGGLASARNWLDRLALEPDDAAGSHALLDRLFAECRSQLDDPDLGFEPLLPAEDAAVADRAEALVEWCRGFLGGIGLAGVSADRGLSSDGAEILKDFSTIAGTRFEYNDAEEDESALSEVLEFIRVGVLLLHTELSAHAPPARATLH